MAEKGPNTYKDIPTDTKAGRDTKKASMSSQPGLGNEGAKEMEMYAKTNVEVHDDIDSAQKKAKGIVGIDTRDMSGDHP